MAKTSMQVIGEQHMEIINLRESVKSLEAELRQQYALANNVAYFAAQSLSNVQETLDLPIRERKNQRLEKAADFLNLAAREAEKLKRPDNPF